MPNSRNIKIEIDDEVSFELIFVEGGTFDMGSMESDDEQPIHPVTVPSFYIGQYPVTQDLYETVMKENPSEFKGARRPVEQVSWYDTKYFFEELKKKIGKDFRLPSESEWEFAARGGIYSQGYKYSGSDDQRQVVWFNGNSGKETKPVGLLLPNVLGLHDMSGNVYDWCEDTYHDSYQGAPDDGSAWIDEVDKASDRIRRGGSWWTSSIFCRSAHRGNFPPDGRWGNVGFRLVLSVQEPAAGDPKSKKETSE